MCVYMTGVQETEIPGEQPVYVSTVWDGKKTETQVSANVRETFKGLSLRIDNVRNQYKLLTGDKRADAVSWYIDIEALFAWSYKLNKYMVDCSLINVFRCEHVMVIQKNTREQWTTF